MQNKTKPPESKAHEALEALEQAYAYFYPETFRGQSDQGQYLPYGIAAG